MRITTSLVVTWPEDILVLAEGATRWPGTLYRLLWCDSRRPDRSLQELIFLIERFFAVLIGAKTVFPYLYQNPLQQECFLLYRFCQTQRLPGN